MESSIAAPVGRGRIKALAGVLALLAALAVGLAAVGASASTDDAGRGIRSGRGL